ncbi:MAG: hypothetical protein IKZ10_01630 [Akkermansia sp.]|nr:hypothetical protein [Akkermansia sp.]
MRTLTISLLGYMIAVAMVSCQSHDDYYHPGATPAIHGPRLDGYVPPAQRAKQTSSLNHLPKLPTSGPHRF